MQTLLRDLRYGFRQLMKNPGFTAVAVLSLALGIGANTALFSLVDAVLLKMLPVKKPEELVLFKWMMTQRGMFGLHSGSINRDSATGLRTGTSFSYPAFEHFRAKTTTLSDVFAFAPIQQLNVSVDGQAEIAEGQLVTGGFFTGLGAPLMLGRAITDAEDRTAADPVAVISYRYWQRRFGLDAGVVGRTVNVNNVPFTIIGVTPPQFQGTMQIGDSPDLSIPMALEPRLIRGRSEMHEAWYWWVRVMGRLKSGVSAEEARAELEGVFQQNALEGWNALPANRRPPDYGPRDLPRMQIAPGSQGLNDVRQAYVQPLRVLMIVVVLTLLIACANVANLLLARATVRRQEVAVRLALGAGRWRLVRQLLTESLLLAFAGAALGWMLAWWSKDLLLLWHPWSGGRLSVELKLDGRVLGFTVAVASFTSLLFGLAPALRATRIELTQALKGNAHGSSNSLSLLSKSLVVAQVAVSLALLVGAGLFVRTLRNLQQVDLGFNAENVLLFRVDPRLNGYDDERVALLYQQMVERIEAIPGVRSATISRHPLLSGSSANGPAYAEGREPKTATDSIVYQQRIRWNFFETMEIPLVAGRSLTPQDDERAPKVAVINQTMARRFFGEENPIGKRIGFGRRENSSQIEIVGVVKDAKYTGQREEIPSTAYLPYPQQPLSQMNFEVRTAGDPNLLIGAVRQAVRQADSNLPLFDIKTQKGQADASLAQERLFAGLTGFFGLLALLLGCIGLYGVMAYSVAQRTREIAIRMALGATQKNVLRRVIGQGMLLAGIGIAIGAAVAFALARLIASNADFELTRFLSGFFYGVRTTDPLTFVIVSLLLAIVAFVACCVPAVRATKVDPMAALRNE
jgi:predicted permease